MTTDHTTITLEAMQQMFLKSEDRLEKKLEKKFEEKLKETINTRIAKLEEKFEPEFLNIYRKISSLEGLFQFLNLSILGIRSDVDILKREAIQINKQLDKFEIRFDNLEVRFDNLDIRIDGLETSMHKQFESLAKETIEYASAGLDNHELRITALEEQKPMIS